MDAAKAFVLINGAEIAYFANNQLYVDNIRVNGELRHDEWLWASSTGGLALKYVGG